MKVTRKLVIFTNKFPLVGPLIWVLGIQYFIVQMIVAGAWIPAYSWATNFISDLGNTVCGPYMDRIVCSPQHDLMNTSFVMLGGTMALGSLLMYQEFRQSRTSLIGFSLMALAGFGTVLVGLFPENTVGWLHQLGAILSLGVGNISLIVLTGTLHRVRHSLRVYTLVTGIVSLAAFILFSTGLYLGIGLGGMERIASYPQTLWLILFGGYMTRTHFVRSRKKS